MYTRWQRSGWKGEAITTDDSNAKGLNMTMILTCCLRYATNYPFVTLDPTQEGVHFLNLLISQTTHCSPNYPPLPMSLVSRGEASQKGKSFVISSPGAGHFHLCETMLISAREPPTSWLARCGWDVGLLVKGHNTHRCAVGRPVPLLLVGVVMGTVVPEVSCDLIGGPSQALEY